MCRCKACDAPLKENEIIWDETKLRWEDLCGVCRSSIYSPLKEEQVKAELNQLYIRKQLEE